MDKISKAKAKAVKERADDCCVLQNGYVIYTYHGQDCCESVYADFNYAKGELKKLQSVTGIEDTDYGFRVVGQGCHPVFVPCYNEQNGYYSDDLEVAVFHNGEPIIYLFDVNKKDDYY